VAQTLAKIEIFYVRVLILRYNLSNVHSLHDIAIKDVVVVVLPIPFRGMGAWRNSTETQQWGHAPGPEVKNGRNGAKDGAPKRFGCGTIQEELSQICRGCPQSLHEEFSFRFILHW